MTWSDGQPVTAQNYVEGICRLLDPTVGNPYYYLLSEIATVENAKEYASGDLADCGKVGITAVDDLTLRIALERPAAFLPKLLAMPIFWPAAPAPSAVISETAAISATTPAGPVVNGPYLLAERVPGKGVTLTKNTRARKATSSSASKSARNGALRSGIGTRRAGFVSGDCRLNGQTS